MNFNNERHRGGIPWHTATAGKITTTVAVVCVLMASGCTPDAGSAAPDASKNSKVAGSTAPATPRLTAEQNRAKAMEAVDNNPNMTPEQKAAAKKQFEAMGTKR